MPGITLFSIVVHPAQKTVPLLPAILQHVSQSFCDPAGIRWSRVPATTSGDSEAMIDWRLEGIDFGNCNCDYGCPCQFESRPTQGNCRGFGASHIDRGHFGDVKLDGLNFAVAYAWPGAVNEGNGAMQAII